MQKLDTQRIRDQIEARQLKRWWVAEQLAINRRTLHRWLSKPTVSLSYSVATSLADLLECSIDDICCASIPKVASTQDQLMAVKALISPDLLQSMIPAHQFSIFEQLAKGLIVPGLAPLDLGNLYMNISLSLFRQSKLDEAATYAQLAKQIALQTGASELELRANMQLSYRAYLKGDANACFEMDQQNLRLAQKLADQKQIAANLSNLGDQYLSFGHYANSHAYQQRAIDIYQTLNQEAGNTGTHLAFCYIGLSQLYIETGELKKAFDALVIALKYAEKAGFQRGLADCYRHEALCHSARHDPQAITLINKASEIYRDLKIEEVIIHVDASRIFRNAGLLEKSYSQSKHALELANAKHSSILSAFAHREMYFALLHMNDARATQHRDLAIATFTQAGLHHQVKLMTDPG